MYHDATHANVETIAQPNNAAKNPLTENPASVHATSPNIPAFTTSRNRPNVTMVSGSVIRTITGRTNPFTIPINNAATSNVAGPVTVTPGIIHAANAKPIAVITVLTRKPCIVAFYLASRAENYLGRVDLLVIRLDPNVCFRLFCCPRSLLLLCVESERQEGRYFEVPYRPLPTQRMKFIIVKMASPWKSVLSLFTDYSAARAPDSTRDRRSCRPLRQTTRNQSRKSPGWNLVEPIRADTSSAIAVD